ncbi:MAG: efflux RND transporter permease subunit [Hyphomicrobiales bacterium]
MISAWCIRHPVATILMSLALIIGGSFAYGLLPVAALPRADFPVVNVSASLPGASPSTMATSVAVPLIKQFTTIAGIDTITTSNAQGSTSIAIQFALNRNIDAAAADVEAAIARAQNQLPAEMTTLPSYRKVNPADAPVILLALTSDVVPMSRLDAFAQQVISPTLSTVEGVAQVLIFGSQKYAVRIEIDPTALASRGIGIDELQSAISAANVNTPVGTLDNASQQLIIDAPTQLMDAAKFSGIVIANRNGRPVRLGDVTRVIDSVENTRTASWYDGHRALILAVQRQPDANTVEVVDRVKATLPSFESQLPAAATLLALNDRSLSIRAAISDIRNTLALTIALVALVVLLFLRKLAATFIPLVAVPISLIATIGVMFLFGYSIDNVSLLGLTLAVGLVVDDAIVMLENIVRHIEEGHASPFQAALDGSAEVGFTIVSISLSLVAVFLPILLMGGVLGRIFSEFAVVVTVAILTSAFVSLTLTPMLCSRLLDAEPTEGERRRGIWSAVSGLLERFLANVTTLYDRLLGVCLRFRPVMLLVFFATVAGTVMLLSAVPKGFFPQEDIGQLQISTEARQDISFAAMAELQQRVAAAVAKSPHVAHVASAVGGNTPSLNNGRLFVELKPKENRGPLDVVLADLRRAVASIPGINVYINPVQNLTIGARTSKSQYQVVVQGIDQALMNTWSLKLADAMGKEPRLFTDVTTDLQISAAQATVVVDRDKAFNLGVSADVFRSSLYAGFGVRQVSTIYTTGDSYEVLVEFDPHQEWTPERLGEVMVRSRTGALVPLGSFATIERTTGPLTVNQLGQLPAVTISYNLPAGVALGQSIAEVNRLKAELGMPPSLGLSFAGIAKTFQDSLANQGLLIGAAILTIYVVLGILYESFLHPLTILSGLPSAVMGALLALDAMHLDLSVIAVIGLLMLIGIVKKNAIMMVDVALVLERSGRPPIDAIRQASVMRFRPIMMTTLAAMMGALPIAIGAGASAELRQPLGITVVAGLVFSQVVTLFMTPVIYLYVSALSRGIGSILPKRWRTADAA